MYAHKYAQTYIHTCTHTSTNTTHTCAHHMNLWYRAPFRVREQSCWFSSSAKFETIFFFYVFNSVEQLDRSPDMRYSSDSAS